MPGTVKVRVLSARNLPIMDRSTYLTDAFVEICIGNTTYKTDVVRRSLSPSWNSDWFCFELDDQSLQEEALLLKVMDHDTYSTHDTIGRVYFDLNPLICRGQTRSLNGWFPIYDTMHGIRGEINLAIRVDVFLDATRYHQSSVGVKFFHSCGIPSGYFVDLLIGFVQELVMNDDPEHQWIERIRTSRASNEARQRLFSRLSGELQRKLGLKVLNLGGNSVIGYQLHFDLEGETGVVVRGIGTAVRLRRFKSYESPSNSPVPVSESPMEFPDPSGFCEWEQTSRGSLSNQPPLKLGEFPFLTISQVLPGMIRQFGSIVASKSVNLMDKNTPAGIQFRDAWWLEIRTEVLQHMHSLNCNAVIGYREECSIYEDVCILSNYGTAVVLDLTCFQSAGESVKPPASNLLDTDQPPHCSNADRSAARRITVTDHRTPGGHSQSEPRGSIPQQRISPGKPKPDCTLCHIPSKMPDCSPQKQTFAARAQLTCASCKAAAVPDLLLASVDFPPELSILGKPALIQARTCRSKKDQKGEQAANEMSEMLPFIEFELHYRLLQKLRLLGMNSVFGLRFRFAIGECFVAAIATGTAVFLCALPAPPPPKIAQLTETNSGTGDRVLRNGMQNQVTSFIQRCRRTFALDKYSPSSSTMNSNSREPGAPAFQFDPKSHDDIDTADVQPHDTAFLETREPEPEELLVFLQEPLQPPNLLLLTTETMPHTQALTCNYFDEYSVGRNANTESLGNTTYSFVRVHEEKLTSPDSFVESTGLSYLPDRSRVTLNGEHGQRASSYSSNIHSGSSAVGSSQSEELRPLHHTTTCGSPNRRLGDILNDCNQLTWFRFRNELPCSIMALDYRLTIAEDDFVQIVTTGMLSVLVPTSYSVSSSLIQQVTACSENEKFHIYTPGSSAETSSGELTEELSSSASHDESTRCLLTPLSLAPNTVVDAYLGNLDFFFIRETSDLRDAGGVCGFLHTSLNEVQAVVGAHTASLGGNALLSYHISEIALLRTASKNQAQCLLNVCGDMARISRVSGHN